jgi:hypothetical protein
MDSCRSCERTGCYFLRRLIQIRFTVQQVDGSESASQFFGDGLASGPFLWLRQLFGASSMK